MIKVNLISEEGQTQELTALSPIEVNERLDVELDSGRGTYLAKGENLLPALSRIEVEIGDAAKYEFIGVDSGAVIRKAVRGASTISKHSLALTEPSKSAQGVLIDGFAVSQPEEKENRKSLYDAVTRLLEIAQFDGQRFVLTNDAQVVSVLQETIAPEFKFNTQTTLWECLSQIGAVIDAIPRLVDFDTVTFDFINAYAAEVTGIDDQWCNSDGRNVEESQYNTALGAIVENLIEEI